MKAKQIVTEDDLGEFSYIADSFLLNVLDQIWIQEVFEPHLPEIIDTFKQEVINCLDVERHEELICKRNTLVKVVKQAKAYEEN